jgi:hypothetical protein
MGFVIDKMVDLFKSALRVWASRSVSQNQIT